jgi:curved DNA-binding protein CbpA
MSFLDQPGDLAEVPVAAVLIEALNHRATGVLTVDHGGGASRLFLREGIPIAAQSFTAFKPIGAALVAAGLIDAAALERSLVEMKRSGRRQGEVLVEMGVVTRAQVDAALAEQQAGYLAEMAALERGRFSFDAAGEVPSWTDAVRVSPLKAIVRALETPQALPLVLSALQMAARGPVALAPGYRQLADAFGWTRSEAALVDRLAVLTSVDDFFLDTTVASERARAILAALLLLGLAAPQSAPVDAEAVSGLVIELADIATRPAPAAAPRRSDPEEARRRRQRLLQRAMQNMGIGPLSGQPRSAPPLASPGPGPGGAGSAVPVPPPRQTAEAADAAELRRALAAAAPRARSADLFDRLGLARGASREQVKAAYFQLARQLHPDRFASPSLADVATQVRDFFAAINEAYDLLSDDRKRAAYLASAAGREGGGRPGNSDSAAVDFQKAEACARTHDYARARGYFEAALRCDPRPEYQAAFARMLYHLPHDPDRVTAKALAEAALRDPSCDQAALVCALLARDEGDLAAAERFLRRALEANPGNVEAQRELRACEVRRGKGSPSGAAPRSRKR